MLDLDDEWVWDFWICQDEEGEFHAFFLKAPRSLEDPELRHHHASVGHAVSGDLTHWTRVTDAIEPQDLPAFDDLAVWTGSVVHVGPDDWRMFITGISATDDGTVQRIGAARSSDLVTWTRETGVLVEADPHWYATVDDGSDETHWRDPWVMPLDGAWHMLATARSRETGTGVVAHATSEDLRSWSVLPPLSSPSERFTWAEVVSVVSVEGRMALVFCCLGEQMVDRPIGLGGVWSLPVRPETLASGVTVDLDRAVRLTNEQVYAGRVVPLRTGKALFLAFRYHDADGRLIGGLVDPMSVTWLPDGSGLVLPDAPPEWRPSELPEPQRA